MTDELTEAIKLVREAGYLVAKIPPCTRAGRGHGKHILTTKSASCPGEEPIPHGYQTSHRGSFGIWVYCRCGDSFSDYGPEDEPSNWEKHKQEHGIT